jgi:Patatin-like phospholipase
MFILAGCSSLPRTAYTASDAASSTVLDLSELRRYADEPASTFLKADATSRTGPVSYLALSGGGADGAYGAGVLNGWTAAGTRPRFSVVSGVSTGALIAPFAFLGPAYDATLRDVYTAASPKACSTRQASCMSVTSEASARSERCRVRGTPRN